MKIELPKGTRDIAPEKKIIRDEIVARIKRVFESYGFPPLETPSFERTEILTSKYAGGEEILKEIFTFKDQGQRDLGLRYDLTVPLARFIAINPTLKMPFKRYAIGRVFRDGPIKKGRLREFYQCDVDIVGAKDVKAELVLLQIANDVFKSLELDVELQINNRKLLNGIIEDSGISKDKAETTILSIDKLEKQGEKYVKDELSRKGISEESIEKVFGFLKIKDISKVEVKSKEGQEGLEELKQLFSLLDTAKVSYTFNISLARGLSYYTSTVFEGFMKKGDLSNTALCGGGRYDRMISQFVDKNQEYPAVGISFGLEVLSEIINYERTSNTDVYIVPIGNVFEQCIKIAKQLRKDSINVDIDISGRSPSKNFKFADSYGIPYCLVIGEDEVRQEKYQLKNMVSGEQKALSIKEIIEEIK